MGRRVYANIKRWVEPALVAAAAPLWLPVLCGTLAATWIDSGRPLLFVQTRMGYRERPFRIFKVRTMIADRAAPSGALFEGWTYADDPRITAVGRYLRRYRLDELPQLINVLRGEMSLIGPRPEPWEIAVRLGECIEGYHRRHRVRPGITGLCQVSARYHDFGTVEKSARKAELDVQYVERQCLRTDLAIALRTVRVLVRGKGVA